MISCTKLCLFSSTIFQICRPGHGMGDNKYYVKYTLCFISQVKIGMINKLFVFLPLNVCLCICVSMYDNIYEWMYRFVSKSKYLYVCGIIREIEMPFPTVPKITIYKNMYIHKIQIKYSKKGTTINI